MAIKKIQLGDIKNSKGKTKKEDVDSLSESEINEAAMSDSDASILTDKELNEFKKVGIKDKPRSN